MRELSTVQRVKHQVGMTLVEVIAAMAILGTVVAGSISLIDSHMANVKSSAVAQHMNTFGQAMQAYIKDQYQAVAARATTTKPALIRLSALTGASYLPAGFALANSYGQNICGLVLKDALGNLNALVVTEGGTAINDLDLGQIAGLITTAGGAGGGIYSTATTTVRGAMGGWSTPVGSYANANDPGYSCNGVVGPVVLTQGHPAMALWFTGGDTSTGLLYRNKVDGHLELNKMETDIDMNQHSLSNAKMATAIDMNQHSLSNAKMATAIDMNGYGVNNAIINGATINNGSVNSATINNPTMGTDVNMTGHRLQNLGFSYIDKWGCVDNNVEHELKYFPTGISTASTFCALSGVWNTVSAGGGVRLFQFEGTWWFSVEPRPRSNGGTMCIEISCVTF